MSKYDQEILVVRRDHLFDFNKNYFNGFLSAENTDLKSRISSGIEWKRRGDMEVNPLYKQPIAYCVIVRPKDKKFFTYFRASEDKHYTEKRLQGKMSIGIGGHIEREDTLTGDPIHESMLRELDEELIIQGSRNPKILGYINDDSDEVGQVHFGILYSIETDSLKVEPKDSEISNGEFRTLEEINKLCDESEITTETWTKIALPALQNYYLGGFPKHY